MSEKEKERVRKGAEKEEKVKVMKKGSTYNMLYSAQTIPSHPFPFQPSTIRHSERKRERVREKFYFEYNKINDLLLYHHNVLRKSNVQQVGACAFRPT
jgi:hypothetical protein